MGPSARLVRLFIGHLEGELMCPVCLDVLVAPLRLPCDHSMCGTCTHRTVHEYGCCPVCKAPATMRAAQPSAPLTLLAQRFVGLRDATEHLVAAHLGASGAPDDFAADDASQPSRAAGATAEPLAGGDEADSAALDDMRVLITGVQQTCTHANAPAEPREISTDELAEAIARSKAAARSAQAACARAHAALSNAGTAGDEAAAEERVLMLATPSPASSQPPACAARTAQTSEQPTRTVRIAAGARSPAGGTRAATSTAAFRAELAEAGGGADAQALTRAPGIAGLEEWPPLPPLPPLPTSRARGGENGDDDDDDDELCCVCGSGESEEDNLIVFCAGCQLAVHQVCYAVASVPEGDWLCDRCALGPAEAARVRCAVCPSARGAFKRTEGGRWGGWMHVLCAQWIPGLGFRKADTLEAAAGVDVLLPARLKLSCALCAQRAHAAGGGVGVARALASATPTPSSACGSAKGKARQRPPATAADGEGRRSACVQCTLGRCLVAFHATCAQEAGCFMRIAEVCGPTGREKLIREILCPKHSAQVRACVAPRAAPTEVI